MGTPRCQYCGVELEPRGSLLPTQTWAHPPPWCEELRKRWSIANPKLRTLERHDVRVEEMLARRTRFDTGCSRFVFQVIRSRGEKTLCVDMAGILERDATRLTAMAQIVTATMESLVFADDARARLERVCATWFEYGMMFGAVSETPRYCVAGQDAGSRFLGLSYEVSDPDQGYLVEIWYVQS